jgi:hypothetical protein
MACALFSGAWLSLGVRGWGSRFQVSGLRFQVSGLRFGERGRGGSPSGAGNWDGRPGTGDGSIARAAERRVLEGSGAARARGGPSPELQAERR